MFYCDRCKIRQDWPESFHGSYGRCEVCGRIDHCHDVPSQFLPVPRKEKKRS